jgi:hypothetical protein
MTIESRINAFVQLGEKIEQLTDSEKQYWAQQARATNTWFTEDSITLALQRIVHYLKKESLQQWLSSYSIPEFIPRKIGVVMAGNIPAAGFHDMLCVLLSGHILHARLHAQDSFLLKEIARILVETEPEFASKIVFAERMNDVEAIIATVADNTVSYFQQYFSKIPQVIRQSRTACAIVTGEETTCDLTALGSDIFHYFGLGSRSVSKVYVPIDYSFTPFFESIESFQPIIHHNKYCNNYEFHKSIYLVNKVPHLDNGFLLLSQQESLVSPVSVLHYEFYTDLDTVEQKIKIHASKTQCVFAKDGWFAGSIPFGSSQTPDIRDYAAHIDTMQFLTNLP